MTIHDVHCKNVYAPNFSYYTYSIYMYMVFNIILKHYYWWDKKNGIDYYFHSYMFKILFFQNDKTKMIPTLGIQYSKQKQILCNLEYNSYKTPLIVLI